MKKTLKRVLSLALALVLTLGALVIAPVDTKADAEEYDMFLVFGGDAAANNDWGYQYYGDGVETNAGEVTATTAKAKVGDTVEIGLSFPTEVIYTWFTAPAIVAEGVTGLDFTINSIKLDGTDVLADVNLGARADGPWWYEETGGNANLIRLAGGYNEWADKFMAESPKGFKEITYSITLNSVEKESAYDMFLVFGGDAAANNDWGYQYYGDGVETNAGEVTATTAKAKVGDTVEIGLTFPTEVIYTWFTAPAIVAEEVTGLDFTINSIKLDGTDVLADVNLNARADGPWWYEETGGNANLIRLAGGYNEWADKFMAESPKGFKEIMYSITINSIEIGGEVVEPEPEPDVTPSVTFDPDGTYNAYIGLQTPAYSFRNAWDEATYGKATEYFNQMTAWENNVAVAKSGTFTDVEIKGNGTYTVKVEGLGDWIANDFTSQDYFNLLFVSTDIPVDADVTFSNIKLLIDGSVKHTYETAVMDEDAGVLYKKVLVQNIWNDAVAEISYYPIPTDSVAIEFTVSGFSYDKAADDSGSEVNSEVNSGDTNTGSDDKNDGENNILPIIIGVVVVVAVAAVVVVVVKKNKKAE